MATHKSIETKYLEERQQFFHGLRNLDRRSFLKVSAAALGATAGLAPPHSFMPVSVAQGAETRHRNRPSASPTSRTRTCTRRTSTTASCGGCSARSTT